MHEVRTGRFPVLGKELAELAHRVSGGRHRLCRIDAFDKLLHPEVAFVHMRATMRKAQELEVNTLRHRI